MFFTRRSFTISTFSIRSLSVDGISRLKKNFQRYIEAGKKVVIFTVLNVNENTRSFVGMLVFDMGVDRNALKKLSSLYNRGLKTIVCSLGGHSELPKIPDYGTQFLPVSCKKIKDSGLPVTYNFGKYSHYCDCTDKDILTFVEYIKSNKKSVAVLGFSDCGAEAIEKSDVFISCAPVKPRVSGRLYEEITSLETDGGSKDASCIQMVKSEADMLIPRPHNENGGLSSLLSACRASDITLRNLKQFVKYYIMLNILKLMLM